MSSPQAPIHSGLRPHHHGAGGPPRHRPDGQGRHRHRRLCRRRPGDHAGARRGRRHGRRSRPHSGQGAARPRRHPARRARSRWTCSIPPPSTPSRPVSSPAAGRSTCSSTTPASWRPPLDARRPRLRVAALGEPPGPLSAHRAPLAGPPGRRQARGSSPSRLEATSAPAWISTIPTYEHRPYDPMVGVRPVEDRQHFIRGGARPARRGPAESGPSRPIREPS